VAKWDVIAAVSESLETRLSAALEPLATPPPVAQLHDLVTAVTSDPATVTLFLYQIVEDGSVRNRSKTTRVVDGEVRILKQPLGLCLHYMVTAWAGDRRTEQRLLGRVLQVLYDDAVLDGLSLFGVLAGTSAKLQISLAPMDLEDRARIWSAIGQTYRLSVNYEVRVVNVEAETELSAPPVHERHIVASVPA
jgi:hypothetical protein